ncbi:hypothetical protein [Salinicola sp. NYA28a]
MNRWVRFRREVLQASTSIGNIIAGGSFVGAFISEQFGGWAGVLGLLCGLVLIVGSAYGTAMLQSGKPEDRGE